MFAKRNGTTMSGWSDTSRMNSTALVGGLEVSALRQENMNLQQALTAERMSRERLYKTVQKLRVENGRLKLKIKRVEDAAKASGGKPINVEALTGDVGFDDIKEFLLIGGSNDPLDVGYASAVKDREGRQYKTGERYLWFKMAEFFGDIETAQQFLNVDDDKKAQEFVEKVKNFDQSAWNAVKMKHFEDYQRLKFEQNRPLRCLLLKTSPLYLAIASQDKTYGTGWRKQRMEASQPRMWDGENLGGKLLMKLRDEFSANHSWVSTSEEEEAKKQFNEKKRTIWQTDRRSQLSKGRGGGNASDRGGKRGGKRGSRGGGAPGARSNPASLFGADPLTSSVYFGGDGYTSFSSIGPMSYGGTGMRNGGGPPYKRRR